MPQSSFRLNCNISSRSQLPKPNHDLITMTNSNATEHPVALISRYQAWREQQWPPKQPLRPVMFPDIFSPSFDSAGATVRPSILCPKCKPLRTWVQKNWRKSWSACKDPQLFAHHATGTKLQKQCMRGCHLCTLLLHSTVENKSWQVAREGPDRLSRAETQLMKLSIAKNAIVTIAGSRRGGQEKDSLTMNISLRLSRKSKNNPSHCINDEPIEIALLPKYTLSQRENLAVNQPKDYDVFKSLPASSDVSTASNFNLLLASRWLEQCTTKHQNCKPGPNFSPSLPSRLLDVGDANRTHSVNLVSTDEMFPDVRYVALSYCWGRSPGYNLTLSTEKTLQSGIEIRELPRTIQDAIILTQKLGLRWLWVDSLCIRQDSVEDWTREAKTMVDVYQNCFLCIAAAGAKGSDEGLFAQRDPLIYKPCDMNMPLKNKGRTKKKGRFGSVLPVSIKLDVGSEDTIIVAYPHRSSESDFHDCFERSALHMRGWVTQERLLSPRTMNFGTVMVWECREHYQDEFGLSSREDSRTLKSEFAASVLGCIITGRKPWFPEPAHTWVLWHKILDAYTQTALTVKTDRLIALAGIIRAIERSTGWRNIGGLWEPFMIRDLLWTNTNRKQGTQVVAGLSWSWVSLDAPTRLAYQDLYRYRIRLAIIRNLTDGDPRECTDLPPETILRLTCCPIGFRKPFSMPPTGNLRPEDVLDYVPKEAFLSQIDCSLDLRVGSKPPQMFVPLAIFTRDSLVSVIGLALTPSGKWPDSYERVGFVRVAVDTWGNSSTMRRPYPEVKKALLVALTSRARCQKITLV